jgi:hypothetical protein
MQIEIYDQNGHFSCPWADPTQTDTLVSDLDRPAGVALRTWNQTDLAKGHWIMTWPVVSVS